MAARKQESIKSLKTKIRNLKCEKELIEKDRDLYRGYVVNHFKDNLKIVGTTSYYGPATIVKNITALFADGLSFKIWW